MEILGPDAIAQSFKTALGDGFVEAKFYQTEVAVKKNLFQTVWVHVTKEAFRKAVENIVKLQPYPHLSIITPSDLGDTVELIYLFMLYYAQPQQELVLGLRVRLPKSDLKIPTITDIIPGALFTEREIQEMMGVEVVGIPDGRRLFLTEDLPEGVYPWRNDETGPKDFLRVLPGRQPKRDK